MWEKNINTISKTAGKFPQESYAAVVHEIQSEWIFLQRVTWDMGDAFTGVEKMIRETFLPCLFFVKTKTLSLVVGSLSTMLVKKSGLGLLNPVTSYQEKYLSSTRGSAELVRAVMVGKAFSNADHLQTLSEEQHDGKKDWYVARGSILKGLVRDNKGTDKCLLLCAKSTGSWMRLCGTTFSGTVLFATHFWDYQCARYNVSPVNLHSHCDGCGTASGVTHALSCSIGGLVIARHNKIREKLLYLYRCAFTSAYVCVEPLMHQGRTRSELEICQGSDKHQDTRGDVMIRGLWDRQVDAIIDFKISNADVDMYKY